MNRELKYRNGQRSVAFQNDKSILEGYSNECK